MKAILAAKLKRPAMLRNILKETSPAVRERFGFRNEISLDKGHIEILKVLLEFKLKLDFDIHRVIWGTNAS